MLPLALTLVLALPAADDSPKAVIEKAVKAHGGAELLTKFTAERVTVKGTLSIMGQDVDATGTAVTQYPGKQKTLVTLSVMGQEIKFAQLVTPDTVSLSINGQPLPLDDEQKGEYRHELYADSLTRLVPLLKGDAYTLKAGPEVAVGGSPAVSVVVERDKHKPVTLSFDKESGKLVRVAFKSTDDGKEVDKETVYSEYKAVQGVQVAHKQVSTKDGKKEADVTVEKYELLEKADDGEFAAD